MKKLLLIILLSVFSFGTNTTVTPVSLPTAINTSTNTPVSQKEIAIGSDGFARILSYDFDNVHNKLKFIRCTNASCTTNVVNTVYVSTTPVSANIPSTGCLFLNILQQSNWALSLGPGDLPNIVVTGRSFNAHFPCPGETTDGGLTSGIIQCVDISCASSTFTYINIGTKVVESGDFRIGIATDSNNTSYVVFPYFKKVPASFGFVGIGSVTCTVSCTALTTLITELSAQNISIPSFSSLHLAGDNTERFAYSILNNSTEEVHYWTPVSDTIISSDGTSYLDMDLGSNGAASLAWAKDSGKGLNLVICDTIACNLSFAYSFSVPSSATQFQGETSVVIGTDGFTRVASNFSGISNANGTDIIRCLDVFCTSSNVNHITLNSGNVSFPEGSLALSILSIGSTVIDNIMTTTVVPGCTPGTNLCRQPVLLQVTEIVIKKNPKFVSRKIIDLIGMNPGVTVPVRSKDGKTPFSLSLIENPVAFVHNNQWVVAAQMVGVTSPPLVHYAPVYPAVPPAKPLPAYLPAINDTGADTESAETVGTPVSNLGWFFIDGSYVTHFFNVTGSVGNTVTTDGSGNTLNASGAIPTITDTGGNVLSNSTNVDPLFRGNVATFTDPNSVTLTAFSVGDAAQTVIYTDTTGLVALIAAETNANSVPPNDPPPTNQYTYTDSSGKAQRYVVFYKQFYQSTNFGCPGVAEMPRTPVYLPIKVVLPDNSFYNISYEPTPGNGDLGDVTGRITLVSFPTGGQTTYIYRGNNNGINCADGSTPTLIRSTPDGTWTYTHVLN